MLLGIHRVEDPADEMHKRRIRLKSALGSNIPVALSVPVLSCQVPLQAGFLDPARRRAVPEAPQNNAVPHTLRALAVVLCKPYSQSVPKVVLPHLIEKA